MSEVAAGTLPEEKDVSFRPTVIVTLLWVGLAGWIGTLLGSFALIAPHALGVASADLGGQTAALYPDGTLGATVANLCVLLVYLWAWTLTLRGLFRVGSGPDDRPAWTWTALTLAPAIAVTKLPGVTIIAPGIVAALALRHIAFGGDGMPRPEPFTPTRLTRGALGLLLPVIALGGATAYAMYHPLRGHVGGEDMKPGRADAVVYGPHIENDGGRTVRILAIEPGVERGYALHLIGMKVDKGGVTNGIESPWRAFRPFTLGPHQESNDLNMVLSRAGCRPGQSGRIESVRIRYRLGGERTMLMRLAKPITLTC